MTLLESRADEPDALTPSYSSVELFAGAGGLALGLESAGFAPSVLIERDERAVDTLQTNGARGSNRRSAWRAQTADVRTLCFEQYRNADLLSAGPPCQPFSAGGHRRGPHDSRDLLPETIRVISEVAPKSFVIENVRGLTFPAARDYFEYTIAQLRAPSVRPSGRGRAKHQQVLARLLARDLEYDVTWRLLNAADFGAPQQRVRLVVVGTRADVPHFDWPEPSHGRSALLAAMESGEYWEGHKVPRDRATELLEGIRRVRAHLRSDAKVADLRWRTVRDVFLELGTPSRRSPDHHHRPIAGARLYPKHRGSPLDLPAKTIKAGVHGTPGGEHIALLDDGSHRYFTVRECAAIQGFPRNYEWPRPRSVALRQIGNAVPVAIGAAVGRALTSSSLNHVVRGSD